MLQQQNCIPTEKSLICMLFVMLDNKIGQDKFLHALDVFARKKGILPCVKSFNLMLKTHCKGDSRIDFKGGNRKQCSVGRSLV